MFSLAQPASSETAPTPLEPVEFTKCATSTMGKGFKVCTSGRPTATFRVAMMGDSHVRQYFPALFSLADKYNWQVTVISKSGCTALGVKPFPAASDHRHCKEWNKRREDYLASVEPFDLIINSNSKFLTRGRKDIAAAFKQTIKRQLSRGTQVVVILDNPKPDPNILDCYRKAGRKANAKCSVSKKFAFAAKDVLPRAVKHLNGVTLLDLTSAYCGIKKSAPKDCPPIIDGIKVYRDYGHISRVFAATLESKIDAGLPSFAKLTEPSN